MKRSAVGLLLFYKEKSEENENMKTYKIAVAGTGYVGLSLSVLLAQHNQVMAVDIVQAKVDMINNHKSPIQDDYIEKYLAEKKLNLTATLDAKAAYSDADFVVIAAPTNVGPKYRSNVESSSKVDKRHQKCEKSYVAAVCRVDLCRNVYSTNRIDVA